MRLATLLLILSLISSCIAFSDEITPPEQPTQGPGGSTYEYRSLVRAGPFPSIPGSPSASSAYYIYQPSAVSLPDSLPVVLFLQGDLLKQEPTIGDTPSNYFAWISHIVKKGYTVVFPVYDCGVLPDQFATNILTSWESALSRLGSGAFIPPRSDAQGLQTGFVGHSIGAIEAFTVAQMLETEQAPIGLPRVIAAFTPGLGKANLPIDFPSLSADTRLIIVEGDEDTAADLATAKTIWNSLDTLPVSQRDFLEVISDQHGTPSQIGNHWFALTSGLNDTAAVDDRDYNVTWKLSVGILDCLLSGTNCSYVLTQGGSLEVDMGRWSDGTLVAPLEEVQ